MKGLLTVGRDVLANTNENNLYLFYPKLRRLGREEEEEEKEGKQNETPSLLPVRPIFVETEKLMLLKPV